MHQKKQKTQKNLAKKTKTENNKEKLNKTPSKKDIVKLKKHFDEKFGLK